MKFIVISIFMAVSFSCSLAQPIRTRQRNCTAANAGGDCRLSSNLGGFFDGFDVLSVFRTPNATTSQAAVTAQGSSACSELLSQGLPQFTLSWSDFASGTKIIDKAGVYTLSSDIVFNPNSAALLGVDYYSAGDVQPQQYAFYNPKGFGIGFFSAISVTADNVLIDLNGHSIVQGEEHALHQRFYTHIELASTPFIQGQGPHDFGSIKSASNVCIKNGVLGRSAHAGIHGNNNQNIEVRDLTIKDFETAGIQFNKGSDILIQNIDILNARKDVPVIGRFSAARFIRPWINKLASGGYTGTLKAGDRVLSASEIQQELRDAINSASEQVLSSGSVTGELEYLFGNPGGLPDGSAMYGIIINKKGVATKGLPSEVPQQDRSKNIVIRNVNIDEMKLDVKEIPVLSADGTTPSADVVGASLQTEDGVTVPQGIYKGNPITNAQLLVAKAVHEGFDFGFSNKNKISPEIVAWAESGASYSSQGLKFLCNGDIQFHVLKGPIGFEFGGCDQLTCERCNANYIQNFAKIGSNLCNDNKKYRKSVGTSNPKATQYGYNGGDARGFSLSSSSNVVLRNCSANTVLANSGDAFGVDIQFGCENVQIYDFVSGVIKGGTGYSLTDYKSNPTKVPEAQEIREDSTCNAVDIQ